MDFEGALVDTTSRDLQSWCDSPQSVIHHVQEARAADRRMRLGAAQDLERSVKCCWLNNALDSRRQDIGLVGVCEGDETKGRLTFTV